MLSLAQLISLRTRDLCNMVRVISVTAYTGIYLKAYCCVLAVVGSSAPHSHSLTLFTVGWGTESVRQK